MTMETIVFIALLWALFALSAAQAILAARALWVERREGLAPSYRRFGAVTGLWALVTAVVVWATASTHSGRAPGVVESRPVSSAMQEAPSAMQEAPSATQAAPPPAQAASPSAQSRELEEIEQLENERAELMEQLKELDVVIVKLTQSAASPAPATGAASPTASAPATALGAVVPEQPPPRVDRAPPSWVVFAVGCLVLLGAVLLLLLGDRDTIWLPVWLRRMGRSEKGADDPGALAASLEKVAAEAAAERYEEGLRCAGEISEAQLEKLDRLDLLYLRALCAVQIAASGKEKDPIEEKRRGELLREAERDLARLLDEAPQMAEAIYLLAIARGIEGKYQESLEGLRLVEERLERDDLPFAHNKSVCLLALAEQRLRAADVETANQAFEEVTRLGVLADQIPLTLITHQLLRVRASLRAQRCDDVREGLERIRQIEGLSPERKSAATVMCDVYELLALFREGEHRRTFQGVTAFLDRWRPSDLPDVDEHTADEYLFPAVAPETLKLPAELFRGFYFLLALTMVQRESRRVRPLTEAEATAITQPLLRALQFEPRQRDVLASLGALTYWCVPGMRVKALAWLRAAVTMGVRSAIVRRLLERDRALDVERREVLDQFMSTSARFLGDPTVKPQVRRALIEELGQFQEFQPLLVELGQGADPEQQSPTLQLLRERAKYVQGVVTDITGRKQFEAATRLIAAQGEYRAVVEALESSATRLEDLERKVMEEIGRTVMV
jgi:hypothetical protein